MPRLILYNIGYCMGMTGRWYEYLKFWRVLFPPREIEMRMIENLKKTKPDILGMIEVDIGSCRAKKRNMAKVFMKELKLKDHAKKIKYPKKGIMRLFHKIPILKYQANAIISRQTLENVKYHELSVGAKRLVIEAVITTPKKLTLLLVHLALKKKTRQKQLDEIKDLVNKQKNPVILMGDFNTFDGKDELELLLKNTDLLDPQKNIPKKNKCTFPCFNPKKRLDYILVSKGIKVNKYQVLDFQLSDHLPILMDFEVKN
ncbi:endonuclease/exonuclease/phosphatase family protein [Nanoarchaeota archaeon]